MLSSALSLLLRQKFPPDELEDLFPKRRADGKPARWGPPPPGALADGRDRGAARAANADAPKRRRPIPSSPILPNGKLHPAFEHLDISPTERAVLDHAAELAKDLTDDFDDAEEAAPPP